jgi:hypothetical protein
MRRFGIGLAAVSAVSMSLAWVGVPGAGASSRKTQFLTPIVVKVIRISDGPSYVGEPSSSALSITFRHPLTTINAVRYIAKLHVTGDPHRSTSGTLIYVGSGVTAKSYAVTPDSGPNDQQLYCNQLYPFSDNNGTYTIQHACGGTTGPWGYKVAPALVAITVGNVSESGMAWTRNGATQPKQAPHPTEGAGYPVSWDLQS